VRQEHREQVAELRAARRLDGLLERQAALLVVLDEAERDGGRLEGRVDLAVDGPERLEAGRAADAGQ